MPNWEEIQREWETTKITFRALAEKHGVKEGTLKSRRSREKWSRNKDATKTKKDATVSKKMQPKKETKLIVENDNLTDAQKEFCVRYINTWNATKAYREVYKCGYDTARTNGPRLLANACIKNEVRRLKSEIQSDLFIDATDITREYMKMAFANITDFVQFGSVERSERNPETGAVLLDDNFKPITYSENFVKLLDSKMVDGTMIQEVKEGREGVSIKLHDKHRAMQELSKRLLSTEELKAQLLIQQIEKGQLELGNMRGDTEGDAHAQGNSYEEALNAQVDDVFADEVTDDAET